MTMVGFKDESNRSRLFQVSPDGMLILGLDGTVQAVNPAAVTMLGRRDKAALLGANWPKLLAKSDRPAAEAALRAAATGASKRLIASPPTRSKRTRSLEAIAVPLHEGSEPPVGVLVTLHDVTHLAEARAAAEAQAQEAVQQVMALQAVAETANLAGYTIDFRSNLAYADTGAARATRVPRAVMPLDQVLTIYSPEDRRRVRGYFERARLNGESFKFDARFTRFDGDVGWIRVFGAPIFEAGECVAIRGAGIEITDEVAAREQNKTVQRRLQIALNLAGVQVFEFDLDQQIVIEDGALASVLGVSRHQDLFEHPQRFIPPQDFDRVKREWSEAQAAGAPFHSEFRVRRADGQTIWVFAVAETIGEQARPRRLVGGVRDITSRKLAELTILRTMTEMREHAAQQKLLLDELNHRVKNTLASVQSVAMQTLRVGRNLEEARDLFIERLLALSSTHDLLVKRAWANASLQELVEILLKPYGQTYSYHGPDLDLAPNFAVSLGMALHELATNALKHGAWRENGAVTINVAADKAQVDITWRESGGPPVSPPAQRGFGLRLLQRGVSGELGGKVDLEFEPGGLVCGIHAPLSSRLRPIMGAATPKCGCN
jgi:PAS domain S-box-containing protein